LNTSLSSTLFLNFHFFNFLLTLLTNLTHWHPLLLFIFFAFGWSLLPRWLFELYCRLLWCLYSLYFPWRFLFRWRSLCLCLYFLFFNE
jgi:hypothetical protein